VEGRGRNPINGKAAIICLLIFVCSAPLWHCVPSVRAADHYNLEENLPTQLVDAIPTAYRNREVQGYFRWEHTNEGKDLFEFVPRLEYGIIRNAQIELEVPFELGSGAEGDEGIGDVSLAALYNFNQETLLIPMFALSAHVEFPTSDQGKGYDTTVKFIMTKTIGRSSMLHRIHFNGAWKHNDDAKSNERDDFYQLIFGYDRRVGPDTMLILDFIREELKEKDQAANIAEAGIRYQWNPLTVLAGGVGAGIGDDSPDFRLTLGFQRSF
jgi:hypothetical protein